MENQSGERCVICGLFMSGDITTVKEKAIERLIKSSQDRQDGKENCFAGKTVLKVHRKCRLLYIEEKGILAARKRKALEAIQDPNENNDQISFDFCNCCLFCGEIATDEVTKKKIPVCQIQKLNTQEAIEKAAHDNQDFWSQEVLRRVTGVNLLEHKAVYHIHCYKKFCHKHRASGSKRGRPAENEDSMERVYQFLENNDDCQFSLDDIRNSLPTVDLPSDPVIKYNLQQKYGEGIIITNGPPSVICFVSKTHDLIQNSWFERKKDNLDRIQLVDTAAKIVSEDIRSKVYNTDSYPSPNDFLQTSADDCPESLLRFLKKVIVTNKKNPETYEQKCTTIAHAIVSAARPRSFRSPLLLGLSSVIHHKYASRYLIDLLSGLGFCSTYYETLKFEVSAIATYAPKQTSPNFAQFVFDNADVNVQTLDGHHTFHSMGGIVCLNPPQTSCLVEVIPRLNYVPQTFLRHYDDIPLQTYIKPTKSGLADVPFQPDLTNLSVKLDTFDLLFLYGKSQGFRDMPGWNSFLTIIQNEDIDRSKMTEVRPLPFISAPPSSADTIFTALLYATEQTKKSNTEFCVVTFDQPLYQKAQEIVKSSNDPEIRRIILRLGGFHLLMSFMGAVGYIMNGSGLKELWASVFALGSIDKMLSGHHYERAVRAHFLSSIALFDIILKETELSMDQKLGIEGCIHALVEKTQEGIYEMESDVLQKVNDTLEQLETKGNTAKLWVTYFKTTVLIQHFIKAERTGDWALHIQTIKAMMPYFLSANHFNYAKSASLYLQDMTNLQKCTTPEFYKKFVDEKLFTIRRTNKPCSGTWSDMTIEQSLMRSMKTSGGVTQGRGLSENVLGKWVLGLPILHSITEAVENFIDTTAADRIPKHKDGSRARIARDEKDFNQFQEWLTEHPPFPDTPELISLGSGISGDTTINAHMAKEVGETIMKKLEGIPYCDLKFSRKESVKSLAAMNSAVAVNETKIVIETDLIFKRISLLKKSQAELKDFLQYELTPYPTSLFDQNGMRKTAKSAYYDAFTTIPEENLYTESKAHVIDGGFLLHRVVWQKGLTYAAICQKYVEYIKKFKNPTVVFDGYENKTSCVKSQERIRRAKGKKYPDVVFNETNECTMAQENFLSNDKNKNRLIALLMKKLNSNGIAVKQSTDDADTLIVSTAIEISTSQKYESVIIVGEDVDLLTILVAAKSKGIIFMKAGRVKIPTKLYNADSFKGDPDVAAGVHAFTGCDSTSAIFRQGKKKLLSKISKNENLRNTFKVFNDPCATPGEITEAGEQIFCQLYSNKLRADAALNLLRYEKFAELVTKSSFDLACLPPTKSAAKQHAMRTYLQVQIWKFNESLNPMDWGWENSNSGLVPIPTLENPAPEEILKLISCKCKGTCKGPCTCFRAGLKCTVICVSCGDKTCLGNIRPLIGDDVGFDEEIEREASNIQIDDCELEE